ncbi:MAG TPA: regulatory protein RecX [Chloroflexota bacterium]|nr:regulatory protein RecX [Chloroflexota bacterium]
MKRGERQREWDADSLYAYGLRLLTYRPRSEREVRQRFGQRGAPAELVDAVVERLREVGLVDDAAFAQAWVDSRRRASPRGDRLLRAELAGKGVARQVVADTLEESGADPLALAQAAAAKKARSLVGQPEPAFRRKLMDFLLRRGFDYDVAGQVVRGLALGLGDAPGPIGPSEE